MLQRAIAGNDAGFALAAGPATAEERCVDARRFHRFKDALVRLDFNGLFRFFQHGAVWFSGRWCKEAFGMEILFGPAELACFRQNTIDHALGTADVEMGAKGLSIENILDRYEELLLIAINF